jgi:hypothetical protein
MLGDNLWDLSQGAPNHFSEFIFCILDLPDGVFIGRSFPEIQSSLPGF